MGLLASDKEFDTAEGRFRIRVETDPDSESPREWSNLGVMVLSHARYDLPREGDLVDRVDRGLLAYGFRTVERWLRSLASSTKPLPPAWCSWRGPATRGRWWRSAKPPSS